MIKPFIIIPAKGDSKRLVGKNKRIIAGKTLLEHSILYAQKYSEPCRIIVTTEDEETRQLALRYGVEVIGREEDYMGEREVADVYVKVFNELGDSTFTHVVGIQPDHPDRTIPLVRMLRYAVDNKYDDLFTVDKIGTRNGSIRIMKSEHVSTNQISKRVGSMLDQCTNIHSEEDLKQAEKNINERIY